MQLVFHQLRSDFRQFRGGLAALWVLFAAQAVVPLSFPPGASTASLRGLVIGLLALIIALVVVRCVQADPFTGSTAWWMTRPITRLPLFGSKTAFMICFVACPWLLAQSVTWWRLHFSFAQCIEAAAELAPSALVFLFFCGALAALTRSLAAFFLAVLLAATAFYVSLMVWYLVGVDRWHEGIAQTSRVQWFSFHASADLATFGFIFICFAGAWVVHARRGCERMSRSLLSWGLVFSMPLNLVWRYDFLGWSEKPVAGLGLQLVAADAPESVPPGQQLLWSHFLVTGLQPRQWALVDDLWGTFHPEAGQTVRGGDIQIHNQPGAYLRNPYFGSIVKRTAQEFDCYRLIKRDYPAGTLWFGAWPTAPATSLPSALSSWQDHPPQGRFRGAVSLHLYDVLRVADLPLRPQSVNTLPGERLTIEQIESKQDGVQIKIRLRAAGLLLSRDERTQRQSSAVQGFGGYLLVIYHPGFGEAYAVEPQALSDGRPRVLSVERNSWAPLTFPLPTLRARLTGVKAEEWLKDARLHAYALVPAGTSTLSFTQDHYTLLASRAAKPRSPASAELADNTASTRVTEQGMRARLSALFDELPENWSDAEAQKIKKELLAMGKPVVPLLLERLPIETWPQNLVVGQVLLQLASREFLPQLRAALRKDINLVRFFRSKGWENEVRDIVLSKLAERRQALPPDALLLVASAKDPATYPDLAWHFEHLKYGHEVVIPALAKCPGFDLPAVIGAAWKRAQWGLISPGGLTLSAAAQGLPEALDQEITQLEGELDQTQRQQALKTLASLVDYGGPADGFARWLSDHIGQFRFDSAQKRYQLAAESKPR